MERELVIQYGDFIVRNNPENRHIDGKIKITKSFTTGSVEFSFVISKNSEEEFYEEVKAVENAFRIPYQNLTIKQGNSTILNLSHTSSTGFNAKPEISKADSVADTGRSRRYTVVITFELPADNVDKANLPLGLREANISISTDPAGKRKVEITGTITALGNKTAFRQYLDIINNYTMSILTTLGGTFELAEKPQEKFDQTNKLFEFSRIYDEIIFPQAGAVNILDDPDIVRQQLRISKNRVAPGDTPRVKRLTTYSVNYSAFIRVRTEDIKSSATMGAPATIIGFIPTITRKSKISLIDIWQKKIKPFILAQVMTIAGVKEIALIEETPMFEFDNSVLNVTMTIMAVSSSSIFEQEISVKDTVDFGKVFVDIWSGNPLDKYIYQAPQTIIRTIATTFKGLGHSDIQSWDAQERDMNFLLEFSYLKKLNYPAKAKNTNFIQISSEVELKPKTMGLDDYKINYTEVTIIDTYKFYSVPKKIKELETPRQQIRRETG